MNDYNKHFDTVPPSAIPPEKHTTGDIYIDDVLSQFERLWREGDTNKYNAYKKGSMACKGSPTSQDEYERVIKTVFDIIFQSIREKLEQEIENIEDRQSQMIKVSVIEDNVNACMRLLKLFDFKLEVNSVLPIINGYINERARTLLKTYERSRVPQHQRERPG